MTWSRQLFQFILCVGLFRSRLRTPRTHYHPMLDPAVLWTPSNDTSRSICSERLNLMPPAPLYLRTLWRYTNAVIIIITYQLAFTFDRYSMSCLCHLLYYLIVVDCIWLYFTILSLSFIRVFAADCCRYCSRWCFQLQQWYLTQSFHYRGVSTAHLLLNNGMDLTSRYHTTIVTVSCNAFGRDELSVAMTCMWPISEC